jgi:hypothetical protein
LTHDLDFRLDVDRTPTPRVAWPSGSSVLYPTITHGSDLVRVTETATFTVNTVVSNVTLVSSSSGRGVTITPAALASPTAAAHTPTGITFTITVASTAPSDVYQGAIYVSGMAAGETTAHALHHGLHVLFAVNG